MIRKSINSVATSDPTAPGVRIDSDSVSPIYGPVTAIITFTRPVTGFVVGDITATNCTLGSFTTISPNVYSVSMIPPLTSGTISIQVAANKCVDINGTNNIASNTLSFTYTADEIVHNLQLATITKSKHFRGHIASYSESTDNGVLPGGEMLMCKYNRGSILFYPSYTTTVNDWYNFGRVSFGCYVICVLYPSNFTTQLPNVTSTRNGIPPSAFSYKDGNVICSVPMTSNLLGGRNSDSELQQGPVNFNYDAGITDAQLISQPSSFRVENYVETSHSSPASNWTVGTAHMTTDIAAFITAQGWYRQFMHWQYIYSADFINYLDLSKSLTDGSDIFFGNYDTVLEYYWVKEAIDSVTGNGRTITINYSKKYPSSPYNLITTPAWIKVDLTGTNYVGTPITTSHGGKIRSVGGNVYYISCPLDFNTTSVTFDIINTASPSYINLVKPIINRTGNGVTSDQPVRLTLWSKPKSEPEIVNVTLRERKLTLATSFTLSTVLDTVNNDYYLGYINAENISGVLTF